MPRIPSNQPISEKLNQARALLSELLALPAQELVPPKPTTKRQFKRPVAWLLGRQLISAVDETGMNGRDLRPRIIDAFQLRVST